MSLLDFDPQTVQIIAVDTKDFKQVAKQADQYELPHFEDFLRDILSRLSRAEEAFGRSYQREVIRQTGLEIVSPFSGKTIISRRSFIIQKKHIFYRFSDPFDFYVVSSRILYGYPLAALFIPQSNCLLKWEAMREGIQRQEIKSLARLLKSQEKPTTGSVAGVPTVAMGHPNFAHHLWNELSAVESFLMQSPLGPSPEVLMTREPLGALDKIFPELADWKIIRCGDRDLSSFNEEGKLFVNLGCYRISSTLRSRVVRHAEAAASAEINSLMNETRRLNAPVFWLSVRTFNRRLINQQDVIIAISTRLLKSYSNCCIIFDGFSLPDDWRTVDVESMETLKRLSEIDRVEIDIIIEKVTQICRPKISQMLVNAGGLEILDTIALAQLVDVYFCHAGTIQHKVGWTANKPGVIHGNRAVLSKKPAKRHTSRIEGGVAPLAIDSEMIEDLDKDESGNLLQDSRKMEDYRAIDYESLAKFVTDYFERCLSQN
jgi:hypothetical protein